MVDGALHVLNLPLARVFGAFAFHEHFQIKHLGLGFSGPLLLCLRSCLSDRNLSPQLLLFSVSRSDELRDALTQLITLQLDTLHFTVGLLENGRASLS